MFLINHTVNCSKFPALAVALATSLVATAACQSQASAGAAGVKSEPVYSATTGRLEQLRADQDGDGKTDTVAFMDGTTLKSIEVDTNGDGTPDRWEYYGPGRPGRSQNPFDRWAVIERAEEGRGPDGKPTRREFYKDGVIDRVEEDVDADGRIDKWELYAGGVVARVDLDLNHKGVANRRLVYGPDGNVQRIERDPDGDGRFEPMPDETGGK